MKIKITNRGDQWISGIKSLRNNIGVTHLGGGTQHNLGLKEAKEAVCGGIPVEITREEFDKLIGDPVFLECMRNGLRYELLHPLMVAEVVATPHMDLEEIIERVERGW